MIPVPVLKWVAALTDEDLRVAYVEALDWLCESDDDPAHFPLMTTCVTEVDPLGFLNEDDIAQAILLEIDGRQVYPS